MKIVVATANEGRGLSNVEVATDFLSILHVLRAVCRRFFVGFQEIDEADTPNEHAILKRIFRRRQVVHLSGHEPMVLPRSTKLVTSYRIHAAPGIPHVSPARYLNVSVVQMGVFKKRKFAFINTHYVAGAFNNKVESTQKERVASWEQHFAVHKKEVEDLIAQGISVIWTGDVNRIHPVMPLLVPGERRLRVKGMDIVSVIEAKDGVKFKYLNGGSVKTHSDHDVQYVVLEV